MIGLEYILKISGMGNTELAERLGIKKQNISRWFKGERKIPVKYLPTLIELFQVDEKYFQKELNEIDKLEIQKIRMENDIVEEEYEDFVTDPDTGEEIPITRTYIDSGLLQAINMTDYNISEKKLLANIKESLDKCFVSAQEQEDEDYFDDGLSEANELLSLYEHFFGLIKSPKVDKNILRDVLRAINVAYGKAFTSDKFTRTIAKIIKEYDEEKRKEAEEIAELFNNKED